MMMLRTAQAAAVAAAALLAAACRGGQTAAPPAFPPTPVSIATARATPLEDATEYVALLKSLRSTTVQPQIDGQITQILVKSGDRVRQRAPLMQIDPQRQQAAVSSQEAERAAREAAVAFARQQAQRAGELFTAGAISRQELEQAETGLRTAEANLRALSAQVQQQQVQLRYFTVAAPTAGVIGDIPVRVGNQVSPQTMLTTIDQNETLELNVNVPIERAGELRSGMPIQLFPNDSAEPMATTAIDFISPRVDDQTQSVLVTAVLRISGQFFAFVVEEAGGKMVAKQRAIKVGPIAGNNYPVLDGIKPGERIVVSGTQKLADGAPIQAAADPAAGPAPAAPRQQ